MFMEETAVLLSANQLARCCSRENQIVQLELCRAHTPRAHCAIYRFIFGAWLYYFCELERNNGNDF